MRLKMMKGDDGTMFAEDLKDGQIAEITAPSHAGLVVQRYKECLVNLGRPSREGWSGGWGGMSVRLLPIGTTFVLTEEPDDANLE